jgi:hypothetical protein
MVDQKAAFAERLKRINSGQQYEHEDVIGTMTQKRYIEKYGDRAKKPKRTFMDNLMVVVAFLSGASAVLLGRLAYFHLSKFSGLPEAFYDLGGRGMALFALILALILIVILHLSTRSRLQSLALGFVLMHFGEAAMASTAPTLWAELFSADYVAAVSVSGANIASASHS